MEGNRHQWLYVCVLMTVDYTVVVGVDVCVRVWG